MPEQVPLMCSFPPFLLFYSPVSWQLPAVTPDLHLLLRFTVSGAIRELNSFSLLPRARALQVKPSFPPMLKRTPPHPWWIQLPMDSRCVVFRNPAALPGSNQTARALVQAIWDLHVCSGPGNLIHFTHLQVFILIGESLLLTKMTGLYYWPSPPFQEEHLQEKICLPSAIDWRRSRTQGTC